VNGGPRALNTRALLRRMQARGRRLSARELEAILCESVQDGVVELTPGGWRLTPGWKHELRHFAEIEFEDSRSDLVASEAA
jgi:hypothetical protein